MKKYSKIFNINKPECQDYIKDNKNISIYEGNLFISEKIDGANCCIYLKDNNINLASRSGIVIDENNPDVDKRFLPLYETINKNKDLLLSFFQMYPNAYVYGEWLVKHTVEYNDNRLSYKNFYIYDIFINDTFQDMNSEVWTILKKSIDSIDNIKIHSYIEIIENDIEKKKQIIDEFFNSIVLRKGEGIVIKNYNFYNKYNGLLTFAKMVSDRFSEDSKINTKTKTEKVFDSNDSKIIDTYCTNARIDKINLKLNNQSNLMALASCILEDILEEEKNDIIENLKLDINSINKKDCLKLIINKIKTHFDFK